MSDKERDVARVSVRILEKEYFVACPHEERSDLLDSAEFLNAKMKEIRDSGKVVGLDRIAVIAALNLANELLKVQNREKRVDEELGTRLRAMRERIDGALARGQQLEL
ncbi:MAG: cell division protein ZapA [Steroidobacteraceae bacterium]|nr:cell division protein ZapA [Steroidobacteraceae bacterium]